ncbi:MAG: hypothetical protein ACRD0H_27585, partial [Actinomycetes bacterium]
MIDAPRELWLAVLLGSVVGGSVTSGREINRMGHPVWVPSQVESRALGAPPASRGRLQSVGLGVLVRVFRGDQRAVVHL